MQTIMLIIEKPRGVNHKEQLLLNVLSVEHGV